MFEIIGIIVVAVVVGWGCYSAGKTDGKLEGWRKGWDSCQIWAKAYYDDKQKEAVDLVHNEYKMKELLKD